VKIMLYEVELITTIRYLFSLEAEDDAHAIEKAQLVYKRNQSTKSTEKIEGELKMTQDKKGTRHSWNIIYKR